MTEPEWLTATDPEVLLRPSPSAGTSRKRRLFVAACCRMVADWLVDGRSRAAMEVLEAFADGDVPPHELSRAERRAHRAAGVVGGSPAQAVAWAADDDLTEHVLTHVADLVAQSFGERSSAEWAEARAMEAHFVRDILGNPFHPGMFDPAWRTGTAVTMARGMYDSRDFSPMPILADALQEAGCDNDDVLTHCRGPAPHVRGCWVVDLVLGRS
jgi:hypothetical protein